MDEKVMQAALAGLLHDIGKLLQRSKDDPWRVPEGYEREGQPVHALWSAYFIEHNVSKKYKAAAYQGVYHHQPEKSPATDHYLSTLVAVADKLSAGERADEIPDGKGNQLPQQVVSIFDRIGAYRTELRDEHHYLPLKSLALAEEAIFPRGVMKPDERRQAYETLCQAVETAARQDVEDAETYLESLQSALEQHTWCVPSAFYHSLPDVSLYDHSRMTAALAVCLVDRSQDQLAQLLEALRAEFSDNASAGQRQLLDEPAALLIGGDISGIQKFIYTISSKNAAKTLRGRSFYLQLLTEVVLRFVLRELGLPRVNVIYSGGGHFFLLAPLSAAEKLPEVQRQITRILLKHHGTALYLAIGAAEVPASGFKIGRFPQYWDRMHAALARAKQQRYTELGGDYYAAVFEEKKHGGNREKTCSVCGEEKEDSRPIEDDETEEGDRMCGLCASFADPVGKYLPQASFATLELGDPTPRDPGSAADVLAEFGAALTLLDKHGKSLFSSKTPFTAHRAVIWMLTDTQNVPDAGSLPVTRILHYVVNQIPAMAFDELQKKAQGIPRLGVLRMDVDDLGTLFKFGFGQVGESIATVARLSSLSFQMSLFFDGWVKKICERISDHIYAVYSGGDDLFLIAPWDIIPGLAARIASDFCEYTSANPDLHISAGMAFIHGKYPVYQAADDAHAALSAAKEVAGKSAFYFLGRTWKWDQFSALRHKFDDLVIAMNEHNAPSSLLQLLQKLLHMNEEHQAKGKKRQVWGKWLWLGDYQLTRMIDKAAENKSLAADLERIKKDLEPSYYASLDQWGKAARWAQLYLRKSKDERPTETIN